MKTTKISSVLSLVLILSALNSIFAAAIDKNTGQVALSAVVRYHVNIQFSTDKPLCNLWMVRIIDENGRQVAPPKAYTVGVTSYDFVERGPGKGTRIAVLVKYEYGDHLQCATELFTAPAVLTGTFSNGQTYRFDLFPTSQAPKE
jgi:hypothetical protein